MFVSSHQSCLITALTIKPPDGEHATTDHKIQPGSLTPPQAARRGDQEAPFPLQTSSHKTETCGMSTANSPTTLPWSPGKWLQQLEHPVAAGHHNLGWLQCICTPYQAAELPSTSHCNRRKEQDS